MEEQAFLNLFEETNDTVGNFIKDIKSKGEAAVIWGAGYCADQFYDLLTENEVEILCFCDNDPIKQNQFLHSKKIYSWYEVKEKFKNFTIVIATSYYDEIRQQLEEEGFCGGIYWLDKMAYYKNTFYGKNYLCQKEKEFAETYHLLEDDISKRVYLNYIKHNISLDACYMKSLDDIEIQGYFGTELYQQSGEDVIVDAGAYNGDTIREFLGDHGRKYKKIYAFEPDTENYENLTKKIDHPTIALINKGVGIRNGILKFASTGNVSSRIDPMGETSVEVCSLDESLGEEKVSFIKMDIEGAEADALKGASEVIKKNLPTLAISAYHKKQDMFELVQVIKSISNRYKIYYRHTFYYVKDRVQPDVIIYAVAK